MGSEIRERARKFTGGQIFLDDLVAFAESEAALARQQEREACAKAVCAACRNGDDLQRSDAGGYYHRTKYHSNYCVAAAIHERNLQEKG